MCAYSVFNTFPVYPLSAKPLILLAFCRYRYHTSLFTSPGYSQEVLHIYLARDLHHGAAHLDPGEFLNLERYPLGTLVQMALDGELCDGKTTVALLKTQLLLARERGEAASGGL